MRHAAALVIEVDGEIHLRQADYDAEREQVFAEMGLRVIRFGNMDVLHGLPRCLRTIRAAIDEPR